jgi:hypothetical protein
MKSIIIYQSHFELFEDLTDEQAGQLIKLIGDYSKQLTQDNPKNPSGYEKTDPLILGIFKVIKRDFDIQHENYNKKCELNKENGRKGGRPKTQKTQMVSEKPTITQTNPENLKDKDKDKDKDKVILDTRTSTSDFFDYTDKPTPEIEMLLDNLLTKFNTH